MAKVISIEGKIQRQCKDRANSLQLHHSGEYFACQTASKITEIYRIRTEEEVKKKLKRRQKRQKEKLKTKGTEEADGGSESVDPQITDKISLHVTIKTPAKVRSFDWAPSAVKAKESRINVICYIS